MIANRCLRVCLHHLEGRVLVELANERGGPQRASPREQLPHPGVADREAQPAPGQQQGAVRQCGDDGMLLALRWGQSDLLPPERRP